jgi:hypothetical protein
MPKPIEIRLPDNQLEALEIPERQETSAMTIAL